MALKEYIALSDINNDIFNRFSDIEKQKYIDIANEECEDLAKKRDVDLVDILDPIHFKLQQYLVEYAIYQLVKTKIGYNNTTSTEDKYKTTYNISRYEAQDLKPQITFSVFTGVAEDAESRAVGSTRLYRG